MRGLWRYIGCVFGVALIISATPSAGFAEVISVSSSLTVTASVAAHVYLIIDDNGNINKIFSNANFESQPIALLGSLNGQRTSITDRIQNQYIQLKPSLDFRYGYIYQKPSLVQKSIKSAIIPMLMFRPL